MPNWIWIVALIVGVLAAGMVRERWRLRGNLTPANVESLLAHLRETRRAS